MNSMSLEFRVIFEVGGQCHFCLNLFAVFFADRTYIVDFQYIIESAA